MTTVISSAHFSVAELECHCGKCKFPGMDEEFMDLVERVRDIVEAPLSVSSAYRCPVHNNAVSSTGSNGPHTTGQAIDIKCSGNKAHKVLDAAMGVGMTGIGIQQKGNHAGRFIHIDNLTNGLRPWVWSY